jgi:hypothetical protein
VEAVHDRNLWVHARKAVDAIIQNVDRKGKSMSCSIIDVCGNQPMAIKIASLQLLSTIPPALCLNCSRVVLIASIWD